MGFASAVKNFQTWEMIYGLSNDSVSTSAYIASHGRMINKELICKEVAMINFKVLSSIHLEG
jgi:hypothetical protein